MTRTQSRSRTVDLHGLTVKELHALAAAVWLLADTPGGLPDAVVPALTRLQAAARADVEVVYKVPRNSLQALADAVRPHLATPKLNPAMRSGFAKVDARLASAPGRPIVPAIWRQRQAAVNLAVRVLRHQNGCTPTDGEIAAYVDIPVGRLRVWRHRRKDLFPPAIGG